MRSGNTAIMHCVQPASLGAPWITRRAFHRRLLAAAAAPLAAGPIARAENADAVPARVITRGPRHHWFGYYDKLQFDPSGRFVLCNEVAFEHRSPRGDDRIGVGMVDTQDGDAWIPLGESRAWNWQQGCMLQWLPGPSRVVVWNDREGDRFVCHLLDVASGAQRTLPYPIYTISPCGTWGIAPDFRRLNDTRPGYGYAGLSDPRAAVAAPGDAGLWKVDLKTGARSLLFSFAQMAAFPQPGGIGADAKHWFNHLLVAPDGKRFIFLHRWQGAAEGRGWKTRMFTAGADGKDLHLLIPSGRVSHFIWRDATHVAAYAGYGPEAREWRFQVFEDLTGKSEVIEGMPVQDGHLSYVPGTENRWIICDSYPDRERMQLLYLFHVPDRRIVRLGRFLLPREYAGEWRCDLHPRLDGIGRQVTADAPHADQGRQLHRIDISGIVA